MFHKLHILVYPLFAMHREHRMRIADYCSNISFINLRFDSIPTSGTLMRQRERDAMRDWRETEKRDRERAKLS